MKIYSLYSKKCKQYLTPTFVQSDEQSIVAAQYFCDSIKTNDDFILYCLGTVDYKTGKLKNKKRMIKQFHLNNFTEGDKK